jgi:hypothetical protein
MTRILGDRGSWMFRCPQLGQEHATSAEDRKAASAGHSIFAATALGSEGVSRDARSGVLPITLPDTRK